jgi:hypothetical protein
MFADKKRWTTFRDIYHDHEKLAMKFRTPYERRSCSILSVTVCLLWSVCRVADEGRSRVERMENHIAEEGTPLYQPGTT